MYLFSGPSTRLYSSTSNDSICSINKFGDVERIVKLSNTNGNCEPIFIADEVAMTDLATYHQYYSMVMINDTIESIHMFCNHTCDLDSCRWKYDDAVTYGDCHRLVDGMYNALFLDYFNDTGVGNTDIIEGSVVAQLYFNSSACGDNDNITNAVLQNIGIIDGCVACEDLRDKYYQLITQKVPCLISVWVVMNHHVIQIIVIIHLKILNIINVSHFLRIFQVDYY